MRTPALLLAVPFLCLTPVLSGCPEDPVQQPFDTSINAELPIADTVTFPDAAEPDTGGDAPADGTGDAPGPDVTGTTQPVLGEVIVTEVMKDTSAVGDDAGEWFELRNLTSKTLQLEGCVFSSANDDDHEVRTSLVLVPNAYAVVARSSDPDVNGGIPVVDYVQLDIRLSNDEDTLSLNCGGQLIDTVAWDAGGTWPAGDGASLSLSPTAQNAIDNDASGNWCDSLPTYGDGDRGTPGEPNPACGTGDPCTPNPCVTPPLASCEGDILTNYAAPGTCAVDAGAASCTYPGTTTNCAAEFGGTCTGGTCTGAPSLPDNAGEVLITEIMKDSAVVPDDAGEWFELHNPTSGPLLLAGCVILSLGDDPHPIAGGLTIEPGQYLVLGRETDDGINGGVTLNYAYGGDVKLSNAFDDLEIACNGETIDKVTYNDSGQWPDTQGKALSLDPGSYSAVANNSPGAWCDAPMTFGSGDFGSPGVANPDCPDPCAGVTCNTPPAATCVGNEVLSFASSGVCSDGSCTYAITNTQDCGGQICQDGACIDPVAVAPPPAAGELVITEVMQNPSAVGDASGEWFEVTSLAAEDVELAGCIIASGTAQHTIADGGSLILTAGEVAVFADNATPSANGGVTATYEYAAVVLSNGDDDLSITCGGTLIDAIAWDDGDTFPDPNGASMYLDGGAVSATSNDDGSNWCQGFTAFGDGDLGSPGVANLTCPGPCDNVVCDTPPADGCVGNVATSYASTGTCSAGVCSYDVVNSVDCGGNACIGGACSSTGTPPPSPGDLVITEYMKDPDTVTDTNGEWFELFNVSGVEVTLEGCIIRDNGSNTHTIGSEVLVPSNAYVVLARNGTSGSNGGVSAAYEYGGSFQMSNSSPDAIIVECGGQTIDAVAYGSGWPSQTGVAAQLDPGSLTTTANDDAANWCQAPTAWSGGDLGSPGQANPTCSGQVDPCDGVTCNAGETCVDGTCVSNDPCVGVTCNAGETCVDGTCVPDSTGNAPGAGDVIFSEVFYDGAGSDDGKEWIELHNTTGGTLDLDGCTFEDPQASHTINNGGPLEIAPGGYLLLAETADSGANGGLPAPDYVFGTTPSLNNDGDTLTLTCGTTTVDVLNYGANGFPDPTDGRSIELNSGSLTGSANDTGSNWCAAADTDPLATVGWGTPGAANTCGGGGSGGGCDDPPGPTCNNGAVEVYEATGDGSSGTCTYAVASTTPCTGGDICEAGACVDPANSNVFSAFIFGQAGDLVITEIMFNPSVINDTDGEWIEVFNYSVDDLDFSGCTITSSGDAIHTIAPNGSLVIPAFEFAVFGVNRDIYSNGGVAVDYEYSGVTLTNSSGDDVSISCDATLIDAVDYSAGFPLPNGASLQFDDTTFQGAATKAQATTDNDSAANWCATASGTTYGTGDNAGTPKDFNGNCN